MEAAIRCPMYSPALCVESVHFLVVGEKYEVISVFVCAYVCVCAHISVKGQGCSWFQSAQWPMK